MARLKDSKGVTLTEMLAVLAILGIIVLVGFPAMGEWIKRARIRSAADQLTVDLRAARYIAVTNRTTRDFNIQIDPLNYYTYDDANGTQVKIEMPVGVRLVSTTSNPIVFTSNGGVSGGEKTVVLENRIAGDLINRYTVTVNAIGKITVQLEQITS
ncbi:MAG: prepilin-type N-terminal cleavage/methylation domain-containing protein [Acidobacteriota bacterium]